MKFIHTAILTVLTVSFMVSVTATPVLVHACQGIVEDMCDTNCCDDQSIPEPCCDDQSAKEPCCDEIVSITRLDCDMVKDGRASEQSRNDVICSVLHTEIVTTSVLHPTVECIGALRTGPDATPSRLCVFLI